MGVRPQSWMLRPEEILKKKWVTCGERCKALAFVFGVNPVHFWHNSRMQISDTIFLGVTTCTVFFCVNRVQFQKNKTKENKQNPPNNRHC